ncbi:MAG: hypothetical protein D8M57_11570 [Candidatus Scalindua sp. AMX11]|nr:MAG: hypothetical protein DWQ00_17880 [Candidatus Scalindua sp.]TDE64736.1 MAG: hypothetical protein D8M57_11570 [Candidatus Scalindua sp. AMX11]
MKKHTQFLSLTQMLYRPHDFPQMVSIILCNKEINPFRYKNLNFAVYFLCYVGGNKEIGI